MGGYSSLLAGLGSGAAKGLVDESEEQLLKTKQPEEEDDLDLDDEEEEDELELSGGKDDKKLAALK